jgi:hypothetical protein
MADDATVIERVQELTWALVDEEITDDEMTLLDSLLLSDDQARNRYIECIQLHVDLMAHYAKAAPPATVKSGSKSPVLGFLNAGMPSLGFDLPPAEDVRS